MPRAKVDPRFRRRVAHACESCKKRKAKCDGVLPCDQCKARRVEVACRYSREHRPLSRDTKSRHPSHDGQVRVELGRLGNEPPSAPAGPPSPSPNHVDVPVADLSPASKESQMLKDSKGKLIYVGESASLSFLETVRSAVQTAVGQCAFTNEPSRNPMIESTPKIRYETAKEPSLDLETARSLSTQFFLAVSGALDLFDPQWLADQLHDWVEHPSRRCKPASAIVHLALAIGAQGRAQGTLDETLAEQCFAYGRQLTMFNLVNDPNLETVRAILLITYYLIAACQYNAAFINLGLAARSAYTLGTHLHETNTAFPGEEGLARERAWKSLRVCDLFLAASLGRPPATTESVSNIAWASIKSLPACERPGVAGQVFSAMFRICNVFERILVEVYAEKAVSLELAKSISRQHRQWTEDLPRMLIVDGLEDSDAGRDYGRSPRSFGLPPRHGTSIVTMAYYYSIVLLTRPFLTFQVRHATEKEVQAADGPSTKACLTAYSDACVNSAIKGIDVAHEYVFELNTPRRQPLVVNSVFISALCLGLAYLDTTGRQKWPMDASLDRAINILVHLGQLNAQSARYASICKQLKEAATIYATRRDDTLLQENDQMVRSIFGDIGISSTSQRGNGISTSHTESPGRPSWYLNADSSVGDNLTSTPFDFSTIHEQSMLPTSGVLPNPVTTLPPNYDHSISNVSGPPHDRVADHAVESLTTYFPDQDVPLFPLTNHVSPESYFGHNNLC